MPAAARISSGRWPLGDVALFPSVPGIGKKTAERLILELREKVGELAAAAGGGGAGAVRADDGPVSLARAALLELGFDGGRGRQAACQGSTRTSRSRT